MNTIEFDNLLALVIADEASAGEVKLFVEAMKSERSLLLEARRHFQLHGQLGVALESEFTSESTISNIIAMMASDDAEGFTKGVNQKIYRQRLLKRGMLAAVLLIGIFSVFFFSQFSANNNSENLPAVAYVTAISGVQWLGDEYKEGEFIVSGQNIRIGSGLLEVELEGRGSLVIEGPAHLELISSMESATVF